MKPGLWMTLVLAFVVAYPAGAGPHPLESNHVVWTEPSRDSSGSMPLGNGDIGLNAWVEQDGDLQFFLSKTDAWDAHARLLKLGRVRVRLTPNPFAAGQAFRQELRLREAEIRITAGDPLAPVSVRLWVDANRPVVRVEVKSGRAVGIEVRLEPWRTVQRTLSLAEAPAAELFAKDGVVTVDPDVVARDPNGIVWYHRNAASVFETTLLHQELPELVGRFPDPLRHRTFGGLLSSSDLGWAEGGMLRSAEPRLEAGFSIHALTAVTSTPMEWVTRVRALKEADDQELIESARAAHQTWWADFWDRSWIRVGIRSNAMIPLGSEPVERVVNRGYILQRFLNACAGRGAHPIKFNGSIFTVDVPGKFDPDYRLWGGCYWFQNTRLPYWPMLASGDFDLMRPLFRMYLEALPLARARTPLYYHHSGAFFPETMHFWGMYHNGEMGYGWERAGEPRGRTANRYIRFHWSGALELLAMMLDYDAFTGDAGFRETALLPLATDILEFYARHYPRQPNGRILFAPAQALETWWECENPMPEVAGLHFVLARLLGLPESDLGADRIETWRRFREELPEIPVRDVVGQRVLVPAESWRTLQNMENAELYAVFPFRLFGVGKPDLDVARTAFARRQFKGNRGWQQDDTQAAFLGFAGEASQMVATRLATKHEGSRFPAFWGPNFDWIPDQDHGANALMTLQTMLIQTEGQRILLFPAWPREWDVEFKLHAPMRTIVEGVWKGGRLERLVVTPASRGRDLVWCEPATGVSQ